LTQLQPGDVGILKNGTYQGASQMLDLSNVPNLSGTAGGTDTCGKDAVPCTPITIRAETDGGVFIDGQFVRTPFNIGLLNAQGQIISTNAYLKFSGFDVGNGSLFVGGGSHFTFQRICASNSQPMAAAGLGTNDHPFSTNYGNTASLYEDICVFGTGRNMVLSSYQSPNSTNVYRRFWMRHEGYGGLDFCDAGPAGQWNYHDNEPYPSIMENVISASTYENLTPGHGCYCPSAPCAGAASVMEASHGNMMGWILYNTDPIRFTLVDGGFFARNFCTNGPGTQTYVDIFADARNHLIRPIVMTSEGGACVTADRLTALQTTSSSLGWNGETTDSFFSNVTPTNYEECTGAIGATGPNIGGCPNFYTGAPGSGGLGSRACFEYQNSTLGSTPLWPWRMDDRIKAALARANAAGTGGSTLAGTFGVGYAANTVTSEIVSRYGAIPDECNRAASGTAPTAPSNLRLGN
jgi:hypothetical protein